MPNQSDRRKLKPKRYNKFEHSQSTPIDYNVDYVPQRVTKRSNTELPDLPNNKKRCYGLMHPSSSTANLANNRLKKLKQTLQADLKIPPKVSTTESSAQNIPKKDDLNVPASPSGSSANNRLKKLKKVIESQSTGSPKFSDSSGHSRPLAEISYTPQCSLNSPKSTPFKNSNNSSSNKPVNILNQFSSNVNKNFEKDSNLKMVNVDKPSNNVSARILKIRKNTEQLTGFVNKDVFSKSENVNTSKNSKSVSERLKLIRNSSHLNSNSNIIKSKPSLDVQIDLESIQNNSTRNTEHVKLNRNFTPSINNNFNTLNNNSTLDNPNNDKSDIIKASPLSEKESSKNSDLIGTQKQPSSISDRLKLNRQSSTSLSPFGDRKNIRECKLNNNLALIRSTPSSEGIPLKNNVTPPSNNKFNSSLVNTPISERLQLKSKHYTPLSPTGFAENVMPFNFKESSIHILAQETLKSLNIPKPYIEDQAYSEEYDQKLKMTASWVISHQFIDALPPSSEISDAQNVSLNVSSGKSDAATHGNMDNYEEMEWTNAEPDNSITEDDKTENRVKKNKKLQITVEKEQKDKEKFLCIIVDTNIFISELSKLTDIINLKISGPIQPLIYIPWMVVTELDELKDRSRDRNLNQQAFNAIKFINKALSEENPRVKGQSVNDMGSQNHIGSSPDDKIIGTCLQALEKYESVILLSNDLNLKNKAMINNIASASANEIVMKIISKLVKTTKTQKIKQKMGILCSEIICGCAKDAYGDAWIKMDLLANPPWPFLECLKRFKKYWTAVFQEKLLKHFLSTVDKLYKLMTDNKDICDDSPNYVEFVKLSLNVCIFLKDIEDYRGSVENVLNDITKIG